MQIIKFAFLALAFAIIIVYLMSVNKEIGMLALVCAGGLMLTVIAGLLGDTFTLLSDLTTLGGISEPIFKTVVKITLICYVSEFAIGLIEDFGLRSLADKLAALSKIIILLTAAPVIRSMTEVVISLVSL